MQNIEKTYAYTQLFSLDTYAGVKTMYTFRCGENFGMKTDS